jgi:hypothetical protein
MNQFMQNSKRLMQWSSVSFSAALAILLFAGCESATKTTSEPAAPAVAVAPAAAPAPAATPAPVMASADAAMPIRIKAGLTTSLTNSDGTVWMPDQGFVDGDTTERDSTMQIANTTDPALYLTERYSMSAFSYKVPNGKYTVKLHFCETYDGITGPGQRVFSFNVEGQDFKDFDVWVKAGGPMRAYIETVNVEVTDGKLDITFTPNVENPEINAIEIIPAS